MFFETQTFQNLKESNLFPLHRMLHVLYLKILGQIQNNEGFLLYFILEILSSKVCNSF